MSNGPSSLRILADDASVHVFPAGTDTRVIGATLARYHHALARAVANSSAAPNAANLATTSRLSDKQAPGLSATNVGMRDGVDLPDLNTLTGSAPAGGLLGDSWPLPTLPAAPRAGVGPGASAQTMAAGPVPSVAPRPKPAAPVAPISVPPAIRPSLPEVPGYPEAGRNAWRDANDSAFQNAAYNYDLDNGFGPNDPGYVAPELLKAWAMRESGGEGSRKAFESDSFQVNKPRDWTDEKYLAGLSKGRAMTPATSAEAALAWARYKLLNNTSRSSANYDAIRRYNGRTDLQPDGRTFSQDYAAEIMDHYLHMMMNPESF